MHHRVLTKVRGYVSDMQSAAWRRRYLNSIGLRGRQQMPAVMFRKLTRGTLLKLRKAHTGGLHNERHKRWNNAHACMDERGQCLFILSSVTPVRLLAIQRVRVSKGCTETWVQSKSRTIGL